MCCGLSIDDAVSSCKQPVGGCALLCRLWIRKDTSVLATAAACQGVTCKDGYIVRTFRLICLATSRSQGMAEGTGARETDHRMFMSCVLSDAVCHHTV